MAWHGTGVYHGIFYPRNLVLNTGYFGTSAILFLAWHYLVTVALLAHRRSMSAVLRSSGVRGSAKRSHTCSVNYVRRGARRERKQTDAQLLMHRSIGRL